MTESDLGILAGLICVAALALVAVFCIRASEDAEKDRAAGTDRGNWHRGLPHLVYTSVRGVDARKQRRNLRRAKRVRARRKEH